MAYDGDDFLAIDEDGYAADRPLSTGLDHLTRNALYHLGNFGHQCSYAERLDSTGRAAKIYSGNPSTYYTWLVRVSEGTSGFEAQFAAAGGPDTAGKVEGKAWLSVKPVGGGGTITKVDGTKVNITNETAATDWQTYIASVDFGATTSREELALVSLMVQSAGYNTADSTVKLRSDPYVAIEDPGVPFARSQMAATEGEQLKVEILGPKNPLEATLGDFQPGSPTIGVPSRDDQFIRDLTFISIPNAELREVRDFAPYDSELIRAHDSIQGAKISPKQNEGGDANYRASNKALSRWHFASIGAQFADKPNANWTEFPRWTYVDINGDVTERIPIVPINDEVDISISVGVIGFTTGSDGNAISTAEDPEVEGTEQLTFSGNVNIASTFSGEAGVSFYKQNSFTGDWPFFQQLFVYQEYTGANPEYPYREGQLFDIVDGSDERDLISSVTFRGSITGQTPGQVAFVEITYPKTTEAQHAYFVVTQPVVQQYVTRST